MLPLTKRPFYPGMAASLTIEPGPFKEALNLMKKISLLSGLFDIINF